MISAPPAPGTKSLFKSPFSIAKMPAVQQPSEPRAQPGVAGDQRSQRPDLEVDWSHLERERAAIAANKGRREGEGRDSGGRGGPLIGANEVGVSERRVHDARDERRDRDERHARDQRGGYGGERDDEYARRSERRAHGDERDRRRREEHEERHERDERGRRAHGGRAGHAPARHYDDAYDQGGDDGYADGYGDGHDNRYDERYAERGDERRSRRPARAERRPDPDELDAWGEPRHNRDAHWDAPGVAAPARGASTPPREQFWEPGTGGLWGDAPAEGESAYLAAPPAGGKAPGKAARAGKGAKSGRKILAPSWLIGSVLSSALVFGLVRFELQHASSVPPVVNPTVNSAQVFTDSLLTNKNGWLTNADCVFKPDGYHLTRGYLAYASVADVLNFDMSVQVTQKTGTVLAPYGLVFRRVSLGNYYVFAIDGNGKWTFYKSLENVGSDIVSFTANPAIKQGLNAQNTLEVKAQGNHFIFFINGTQVGQADDSSLATKGALGVAGHDDIEVVFTSFSLKRLA